MYKRIFSLLARSADIHLHPSDHLSRKRHSQLRTLYSGWVDTLAAQISALPDGVFDTELPELDIWFMEEIEALRVHLSTGLGASDGLWVGGDKASGLQEGWDRLRRTAKRKFGWQIGELKPSTGVAGEVGSGEEDEEEGEYAPVIVEM